MKEKVYMRKSEEDYGMGKRKRWRIMKIISRVWSRLSIEFLLIHKRKDLLGKYFDAQ